MITNFGDVHSETPFKENLSDSDIMTLDKEFQKRHSTITMRYSRELYDLLKEYVYKRYSLKEGDVVKVCMSTREPFYMVIEGMYIEKVKFRGVYEQPLVWFAGHIIDKDGYDCHISLSETIRDDRHVSVVFISAICNIKPKGIFRPND